MGNKFVIPPIESLVDVKVTSPLNGDTIVYQSSTKLWVNSPGGGGSGTVTTVSVATANGVSGTVANPTTTPAITLVLGDITPTSVNAIGTVAGSNLSGTNTGDQVVPSNTTATSNQFFTAYNSTTGAFTKAQPAIGGISGLGTGVATWLGTPSFINLNSAVTGDSVVGLAAIQALTNKDLTSGTNTFPTFNQNTTGSAAKWTTPRNLAGNSVDGSANVAFSNKFIVQGTADAGLSAAQFMGALGTGIVKNTTTTGVQSIAVAGDFPTLNQNTTGSAATLTTPRAINGVNFDGSAAITVTAAAGTLTGTTLNGTVTGSSLTSVGAQAQALNMNSHLINNVTDPSAAQDAATKNYVDNAVLGQDFKEACKYASTAVLPSIVYANGSSGVGATLTGVALAAISLDSSSPSVNDRVLIKNQASTFQNGIYTVTATGSGIAVFVLTRATDFNQSAEIKTGDSTFITAGSTLSATTWAVNSADSPVIGTDPITFAQVAGQGSFTGGYGIIITGTSIAADASVTTAAGTIIASAAISPPTGYLACDGTAVSRVTYAALFAVVTISSSATLTSGSKIVTGISSTTGMKSGWFVSGTGIAAGTKISTVDSSTQVTLDTNATSSVSSALIFSPYGIGDGSTTFNVPDLLGRVPIGAGAGASLTTRSLGAKGGEETHLLLIGEIPSHTHTVRGGTSGGAAANLVDSLNGAENTYTTGSAGSSGTHNNMQPFLVVNYFVKT